MKLLFYGTYPDQGIGYGKIANILSNNFASQDDIEVYYFGIANYPEIAMNDRFIHPKIKFIDVLAEEQKIGSNEKYGVDLIERFILEIKPDIFFIYNDLVVTCRLFNVLLDYRDKYKNQTKVICYIDLVYPYERLEYIQHMDKNSDYIYTFSECWKHNLIEMGIKKEKIGVLYHGITTDHLKLIPKIEARNKIGLKETDFIILNTNRNCYRKANDITISSFIQFLKQENFNANIKLYINCEMVTSSGYDLVMLIKTECIRYKVSFEKVCQHILTPGSRPGNVSDDMINIMYNACDIGVNTCMGEGFGLCNAEQAYLGKPQVLSAVGALKDIFPKKCTYFVEPCVSITVPNNLDAHNGDIAICNQADVAKGFSYYYHNRNLIEKHGKIIQKHVSEKYKWSNILKKFNNEFWNIIASL